MTRISKNPDFHRGLNTRAAFLLAFVMGVNGVHLRHAQVADAAEAEPPKPPILKAVAAYGQPRYLSAPTDDWILAREGMFFDFLPRDPKDPLRATTQIWGERISTVADRAFIADGTTIRVLDLAAEIRPRVFREEDMKFPIADLLARESSLYVVIRDREPSNQAADSPLRFPEFLLKRFAVAPDGMLRESGDARLPRFGRSVALGATPKGISVAMSDWGSPRVTEFDVSEPNALRALTPSERKPGKLIRLIPRADSPAYQIDISTTGLRPRSAYDLAVVSGVAYVADQEGLISIDVSDPLHPRSLGRCSLPNYAHRVRVVGKMAYVACGEGGFQAVDITDPAKPIHLGGLKYDHVYDFAVHDSIACLAAWDAGMIIARIAQGSAPVLLAVAPASGDCGGVAIQGSVAYGTFRRDVSHNESDSFVERFSLVDPARPIKLDETHELGDSEPQLQSEPDDASVDAKPDFLSPAIGTVGPIPPSTFLCAGNEKWKVVTIPINEDSRYPTPRWLGGSLYVAEVRKSTRTMDSELRVYTLDQGEFKKTLEVRPRWDEEDGDLHPLEEINGMARCGDYLLVAAGGHGLVVLPDPVVAKGKRPQ